MDDIFELEKLQNKYLLHYNLKGRFNNLLIVQIKKKINHEKVEFLLTKHALVRDIKRDIKKKVIFK